MRTAAILLFAASLNAQHLDFKRVFPPEDVQRRDYESAIERLERMRGGVAGNPATAIQRYNDALRAEVRLESFHHLRYATDTSDVRDRDAEDALSADFDKRTEFFLNEIAKVPLDRVPARYRWFATRTRSNLPAVPAAPMATTWASELHDLLDGNGKDPQQQRDVYAFTLLRLARNGNAIAQLQGAKDAATAAYARSGLTKVDVARILVGVAAHADLYKRYLAIKTAPANPPAFTFDDARRIILASIEPAGAAYRRDLEALLDPANGRIDLGPGEHRMHGGFSKGFAGFPSVFYMQNFDGTYNAMRIVAHESTHAIQRQLMSDHDVPPVYMSGPSFLAEGYAMFHELLLADSLARNESDKDRKAFFIRQFLDGKGLRIIFVAAAEAQLEQDVYDGVANDTIHNADDLDALAKRTAARFGVEKLDWKAIPLMYDDPFYDFNYTLGGLVALSLLRHPSDGYAALLANGYTESADGLLKRFVSIDMHGSDFIDGAFATAAERVAQLAPAM